MLEEKFARSEDVSSALVGLFSAHQVCAVHRYSRRRWPANLWTLWSSVRKDSIRSARLFSGRRRQSIRKRQALGRETTICHYCNNLGSRSRSSIDASRVMRYSLVLSCSALLYFLHHFSLLLAHKIHPPLERLSLHSSSETKTLYTRKGSRKRVPRLRCHVSKYQEGCRHRRRREGRGNFPGHSARGCVGFMQTRVQNQRNLSLKSRCVTPPYAQRVVDSHGLASSVAKDGF